MDFLTGDKEAIAEQMKKEKTLCTTRKNRCCSKPISENMNPKQDNTGGVK